MRQRAPETMAGRCARRWSQRAGRAARLPGHGHSWALGGLLLIAVVARSIASQRVHGPWISPDESVYGLLGQGLYRHGSLTILGGPTPFYSLVVPVLVGPFLSIHDLELGYALLKPFQALLMSLVAVPVYSWLRALVSPRKALLAAALTLALPGFAYSGLVMSEVAYLPVLTLATWAMARAIAEPTPRRQALLVGAVALALLTRLQSLALLPVFVGAVGLDALFARSWRRALASWRAGVGLGLLLALGAGSQALRGESVLGGYDAVQSGDSVSFTTAARFILYHAGDLVLTTGVAPVCALLVLALWCLTGRREIEAAARATIAATLALAVGMVLLVGVFAAQNVGQLAERDLLALSPALIVCFLLWLELGAPRTSLTSIVAGGLALAAVCALPLATLVSPEALPDAITLAPLWKLQTLTSNETLTLVVQLGAAAAVALFLVARGRWLVVLPALLLAAALAGSVSSAQEVVHQTSVTRKDLIGPDPRWIDKAAHGPVTIVADSYREWPAVWQALFWNRSITAVTALGGKVSGPVPQLRSEIGQGGVIPVRTALAVIPSSYRPDGSQLAFTPQQIPGQTGLGLWQLTPPARLVSSSDGFQANGDLFAGIPGTLTAYDCSKGNWGVTLLVKEPQVIVLRQDGTLLQRVEQAGNTVWRGNLPSLPPLQPGGGCTLQIESSGLLGTTRLEHLAG